MKHCWLRIVAHNSFFSIFLPGYVICFLLARLPYFLNYDIPGFTRDTFGYYQPVTLMLQGKLPVFDQRAPVYPVFLYLCHLAGLTTNMIFLAQSILSLTVLICCQYLVNRHLPRCRWLFFLAATLFYASAKYLNFNTKLNPIGLFADLSVLSAVFTAVALKQNTAKYFLLASLSVGTLMLMRLQGFYFLPVAAAISAYLLIKRQYRQTVWLMLPALSLMLLFLTYNKFTFGSFQYSKFQTMNSLGSSVFYLDDGDHYSEKTRSIIKKVKESFAEDDRHALASSWSYKKLSGIFSISNYDKMWEFRQVYEAHPEELKRLAVNSKKKCPFCYLKFVYVNLVNSFLAMGGTYYFYYNELVNRRYYMEQTGEFTFMSLPEEAYRLTFGEYADVILKKAGLWKTGIISEDLDYTRGFKNENKAVKLNHYYQIMYSKIFGSRLWLFFFGLAAVFSLFRIIISRVGDSGLLLLQLPALMLLMNNMLVSFSIPPAASYVFPTEIFLYFYPVSVALYFCRKT